MTNIIEIVVNGNAALTIDAEGQIIAHDAEHLKEYSRMLTEGIRPEIRDILAFPDKTTLDDMKDELMVIRAHGLIGP